MSADSPTGERDAFSFSNDRSTTPPPTTSSYMLKHETATKIDKPHEELGTSQDPKDEKDEKEDKDKDGPLGPGANLGYKKDEESIAKVDSGKKDEGKGYSDKKVNGDALDGMWIPPPPPKEDEEDDQCVKCLYYAMQCCECTII